MNVLILKNDIQDLISPNSGEFQLYFYKNLFDTDEKSKILSHQTDVGENQHIIKNFKEEYEL